MATGSDCRLEESNITSNLRKEHPENSRLVRLTLIPRKMMEQPMLETICRFLKDWKVLRNNQHAFTKQKLINFCD